MDLKENGAEKKNDRRVHTSATVTFSFKILRSGDTANKQLNNITRLFWITNIRYLFLISWQTSQRRVFQLDVDAW